MILLLLDMENEPKIGRNEFLVTRVKIRAALGRAKGFCVSHDVAVKLGLDERRLMLFETYFAFYYTQKNPLNIHATELSRNPRVRIAQSLPILGWFVRGTLMSSITGELAAKELMNLANERAKNLGNPRLSNTLQKGANFVTTAYFRQDLDPKQRGQIIEDTLSRIRQELDSERIQNNP